MDYHARTPQMKVVVVKPNYDSAKYLALKTYTFDASENTDLIGYSFQEALVNPDSPFSLNLLPTIDAEGNTWLDKIEPSDLVFIHELSKARYAGVVSSCRMNAVMSESGPQRSVSVSGYGMGGLLSRFQIVLDLKLFSSNATAEGKTRQLMSDLSSMQGEGAPYGAILQKVYDNFMALAAEAIPEKGFSVNGTGGIIKEFIVNTFSDKVKVRYPMAFSLYQTGANNIWQVWSQMLSQPITEMFGRWEWEDSKYHIYFRQNPYSPEEWKGLKTHTIPRLLVTQADLGRNSEEVSTVFMSVMPGSGYDLNKTMIIDQAKDVIQVDTRTWSRYGYRPMFPELRYFDRATKATSAKETMTKLGKSLKEWYGNMDQMYSGTISMMTIDDKNIMEYPRVGEKASFLGGEFYIEGIEHSWKYGMAMETKLNVTRGAVYKDGVFSGKIPKMGGII